MSNDSNLENKNDKRPSLFSRKYFIIPSFQKNFLMQVIGLTMVVLAGFYLLEMYVIDQILELEQNQFLSSDFLYPLLKHKMQILFSAKVLFVGITLVAWGIIFSHRIAGPIWRIMEILKKIEDGDGEISFQLRKNDHFKSLAEKLEKFYKDGRLK